VKEDQDLSIDTNIIRQNFESGNLRVYSPKQTKKSRVEKSPKIARDGYFLVYHQVFQLMNG
jgi:hypothetical protein